MYARSLLRQKKTKRLSKLQLEALVMTTNLKMKEEGGGTQK
jgi:hypothetical protein